MKKCNIDNLLKHLDDGPEDSIIKQKLYIRLGDNKFVTYPCCGMTVDDFTIYMPLTRNDHKKWIFYGHGENVIFLFHDAIYIGYDPDNRIVRLVTAINKFIMKIEDYYSKSINELSHGLLEYL